MRLAWLERWIKTGSLHLHMPGGETISVGSGEPAGHVHVHRKGVLARMLRSPDLAVGEGYMAGDWSPGEGGLLPLFELYFRNTKPTEDGGITSWLRRGLRIAHELNGRRRSRSNVHRHYDLDEELFHHFLGRELHYSCAYYREPGLSLEAAQRAKAEHLARKLDLAPGQKVLDIGSGWGGLALYLAETRGVRVDGLTLSDHQYRESVERAGQRGLAEAVQFYQRDYREHSGCYDAIVSVGMFEHVGRPQYATFFAQVARLLAPGGRAVLHTIGRTSPPVDGQSWISRRIFPGGYVPALSEVAPPLEQSGLVLSDLEVWRRHYAHTLREWNRRFQATREHFVERMGEDFCRMWEFYLQGCEAVFTWGPLVVFQFQMAKRNDVLPITRDYLYAEPAEAAQQKSA